MAGRESDENEVSFMDFLKAGPPAELIREREPTPAASRDMEKGNKKFLEVLNDPPPRKKKRHKRDKLSAAATSRSSISMDDSDSDDGGGGDGVSFMDFLRSGPPNPLSTRSGSSVSNTASGEDSESDSEMSLFDFLQSGPASNTPKSPRGSGVKTNLKQSAPSQMSRLHSSHSTFASGDSSSLTSSGPNDSPSKEMLSKPKKRGSERPDKVKMSNSPRVLDKAERKNSMPLPMVRETSKGEMRVPGSARAHSSSELPQPVAYRGASSPALIAKPSESEETQEELKACTLAELITLVTTPAPAHQMLYDLLLTYRSICSPEEFLNAVLERFESIEGDSTANVVRLRCINVFRSWIDKYWFDFEKDLSMLHNKLKTWNQKVRGTPEMAPVAKAVETLLERLNKVIEDPPKRMEMKFRTEPPEIIRPLPVGEGEHLTLLHCDPEELARQMTLIDEELWRAIEPWELLGQAWTKDEKDEKAPNVLAMIVRFNTVNRWVQATLLTEENVETRITKLKHIVRTLRHLIMLRNFNGALQIVSALNSSAVFRLKKTFEALTDKELGELDAVKDLVSRENNYKNLRLALSRTVPPCIPYLGMYLTDLIFIEDGMKNTTAEGLINFTKRQKIASVIRLIQALQGERYSLQTNMLKDVEIFDDDANYQLSQFIEPRGGGAPTGERPEALKSTTIPPNYKLSSLKKLKGQLQRKPSVNHKPLTRKKTLNNKRSTKVMISSGGSLPNMASLRSESEESSDRQVVVEDSSFNEIIEQVTQPISDPQSVSEMLLTYRSICGAEELLLTVLKRFRTIQGVDAKKVRLSCLAFIRTWKNEHWYDFSKDRGALITNIKAFKEEIAISDQFAEYRSEVDALLQTVATPTLSTAPLSGAPPQPILPTAQKIQSILDVDPVELVRQLTVADEELFGELRPWELLDSGWIRPSRDRDCPTVMKLTKRHDELRGWVMTTILTEESSKLRKALLKHWIAVAYHARDVRNYHLLVALMSGLTSPPIARLKKLWSSVSKSNPKTSPIQELVNMTAGTDNYRTLRSEMSRAKLPYLPCLRPYLEELLRIEESHALFGQESHTLINYAKRKETAAIIRDLLRHQQQLYSYQLVFPVRSFINDVRWVIDRTCEQLSTYVEPPSGSHKFTKPRELMNRAERIHSGIYVADEDWQSIFPIMAPPDYPFKSKDDDSNIRIGNRHGVQVVYGGTFVKLVERACIAPVEMVPLDVFLTTYRQFGTAEELFNLLEQRFRVPPLASSDKKAWANYTRFVVQPIQERKHVVFHVLLQAIVINILTAWVSNYYFDFIASPALVAKLKLFISDTLAVIYPGPSHALQALLEAGEAPYSVSPSAPPPQEPNTSKPPAECSSRDFEPLEIARQLTLIFHGLLSDILPTELQNLAYTVPSKSPKLHIFTRCVDDLSKYDISSSEEDLKQMVRHWLLVMAKFKSLRNWVGYAGCAAALVRYLQSETITDLATKYMLEEAHRLFFDSKHYNKLKSRLYESMDKPPAIPYMRPILEDLEFIEKSRHPEEYLKITNWTIKVINMLRCTETVELLSTLFFPSQRTKFNFHPVPIIQEWYTSVLEKSVNMPALKIVQNSRDSLYFFRSDVGAGASGESDESIDSPLHSGRRRKYLSGTQDSSDIASEAEEFLPVATGTTVAASERSTPSFTRGSLPGRPPPPLHAPPTRSASGLGLVGAPTPFLRASGIMSPIVNARSSEESSETEDRAPPSPAPTRPPPVRPPPTVPSPTHSRAVSGGGLTLGARRQSTVPSNVPQ